LSQGGAGCVGPRQVYGIIRQQHTIKVAGGVLRHCAFAHILADGFRIAF
jgi:hypothetical protein